MEVLEDPDYIGGDGFETIELESLVSGREGESFCLHCGCDLWAGPGRYRDGDAEGLVFGL